MTASKSILVTRPLIAEKAEACASARVPIIESIQASILMRLSIGRSLFALTLIGLVSSGCRYIPFEYPDAGLTDSGAVDATDENNADVTDDSSERLEDVPTKLDVATSSDVERDTLNDTVSVDVLDGASEVDAALTTEPPDVAVDGRRVIVNGEELQLRGVNWHPVPVGAVNEPDWRRFIETDADLISAAGFNAVRTFQAIDDTAVLDVLHANGVWVVMTVYIAGAESVDEAVARVEAVQEHPAVLMWQVGNEWNYNNLYSDLTPEQAMGRVEEVAARIQAVDDRPVATVYGELPSQETIEALPSVDVWGINSYRFDGFYGLFEDWAARSEKPMYVAEYGVDAWNANLPGYDPDSHARFTRQLTEELVSNHTSRGGPAFGGCIFEFSDEWWKDAGGDPAVHDTGGVAPGGGPAPDRTFNEEWWGLVDVNRVPRPAYDAITDVYGRAD